jgi:DNA-binding NarL/FixJ family response regulator
VRVVIADDAALVRSGLTTLLAEQGVQVVGQAGDAPSVLTLVDQLAPDAAIVDIRMPPTHTTEGIAAAKQIRSRHPEVAVLVLSQYAESAYAMDLIADNPDSLGYLLKDGIVSGTTLVDALRRLTAGECVVDPALVRRMLARARVANPLEKLTPREREVLGLMAEGRSNTAIAEELAMGHKTLETHINRVFTKLDLGEDSAGHRRVLAVLAYLRRGVP